MRNQRASALCLCKEKTFRKSSLGMISDGDGMLSHIFLGVPNII